MLSAPLIEPLGRIDQRLGDCGQHPDPRPGKFGEVIEASRGGESSTSTIAREPLICAEDLCCHNRAERSRGRIKGDPQNPLSLHRRRGGIWVCFCRCSDCIAQAHSLPRIRLSTTQRESPDKQIRIPISSLTGIADLSHVKAQIFIKQARGVHPKGARGRLAAFERDQGAVPVRVHDHKIERGRVEELRS